MEFHDVVDYTTIAVLWYDNPRTSEQGLHYARSSPRSSDSARNPRSGQDRYADPDTDSIAACRRGAGQVHPRRAPAMNPVTATRSLAQRNSNGLLALGALDDDQG